MKHNEYPTSGKRFISRLKIVLLSVLGIIIVLFSAYRSCIGTITINNHDNTMEIMKIREEVKRALTKRSNEELGEDYKIWQEVEKLLLFKMNNEEKHEWETWMLSPPQSDSELFEYEKFYKKILNRFTEEEWKKFDEIAIKLKERHYIK